MNPSTFDFNLLKSADALLSERSVTRAAQRIGITQQAMSGQLKRLRELFDDQLLVPTGRSLLPTALGETLAAPVRDVMLQVQRTLVVSPAQDASRSRRVFVIRSANGAGVTLLPAAARALAELAPRIGIAARAGDGASVTALAEGRCDLCILPACWRETLPTPPDEIRSEALYADDHVCVAEVDHPSACALDRDGYANARHAMVNPDDAGSLEIRRAWAREGIAPHVAMEQATCIDLLLALPGTGMIATVQRRVAGRWAACLGLAVFHAPFAIDAVRMDMLWHVRDEGDAAHVLLRDAVRAGAAA